MKRTSGQGFSSREIKLTPGVTAQDEGDGFYLVLCAGECDLTLALPDASARKLVAFLGARLSQRDSPNADRNDR